VTGFRPFDKDAYRREDDLFDAAMYAVLVSLSDGTESRWSRQPVRSFSLGMVITLTAAAAERVGAPRSTSGGTWIRKGLQRADAMDDALDAERPEGAWLH
jgi:hypothetical protein